MNVRRVICDNCSGIGKRTIWKVVDVNDHTGTAKTEKIVCRECNGKGYTEYATFTIEEAEAILKHCGLSTEC